MPFHRLVHPGTIMMIVEIIPRLLAAMALRTSVALIANLNQTVDLDMEDAGTNDGPWKVAVDMARLCQLALTLPPIHRQGLLYSIG